LPLLPLDILYEDNHCLAVNKPARLPTAGDESGDLPLLERARDYLREKYQKPGNVFVGLVHRLDRPVSGVVLFARTSKAAARLSDQFRRGTVTKTYQTVVEGRPPRAEAELVDWLLKDEARNIVRRVPAGTRDAKESVLRYRVLRSLGSLTLVEITPVTGRSHQIRVQLAGIGTPIYGDVKYGSTHRFHEAIALHAATLEFEHPTSKTPVKVHAPLPSTWKLFGIG
jgi:23S rRNA pseudouridine1911/1915/1917 synthase